MWEVLVTRSACKRRMIRILDCYNEIVTNIEKMGEEEDVVLSALGWLRKQQRVFEVERFQKEERRTSEFTREYNIWLEFSSIKGGWRLRNVPWYGAISIDILMKDNGITTCIHSVNCSPLKGKSKGKFIRWGEDGTNLLILNRFISWLIV